MRKVLTGAVLLALWACPALAGDRKADIDFVARAATADRVALAEARLAVDRAADPRVQAFARQLAAQHGAAQTALDGAAREAGAPVPAALDQEEQGRVSALQGRSGADFDRAFLADQVEVHSNALTLYGDYMLLGEDAGLKALAIRMIPVTEAQDKAARALLAP